MVFNTTFNNISAISWRSVLLVEKIGLPGKNRRPAASHWKTLSHNVVSSTPRHERDLNRTLEVIGIDCTGSCEYNYHAITTTTAPHCIISSNQSINQLVLVALIFLCFCPLCWLLNLFKFLPSRSYPVFIYCAYKICMLCS